MHFVWSTHKNIIAWSEVYIGQYIDTFLRLRCISKNEKKNTHTKIESMYFLVIRRSVYFPYSLYSTMCVLRTSVRWCATESKEQNKKHIWKKVTFIIKLQWEQQQHRPPYPKGKNTEEANKTNSFCREIVTHFLGNPFDFDDVWVREVSRIVVVLWTVFV